MSIINDALKKARKEKDGSGDETNLILSEKDKIKKYVENYVLKRKLFFAGAAIVCLLGIIFATRILPGPSDKSIAKSVLMQGTIPEAESLSNTFYQRKIDIELPFKDAGFRLTGILYDEDKPMAIVNDRIVSEGSLIEGAQILDIQPNSVKLLDKGEELTLKIK